MRSRVRFRSLRRVEQIQTRLVDGAAAAEGAQHAVENVVVADEGFGEVAFELAVLRPAAEDGVGVDFVAGTHGQGADEAAGGVEGAAGAVKDGLAMAADQLRFALEF